MYTNADSLINKRTELKLLLDSLPRKPHIIAITEVKPKCRSTALGLTSGELCLDGYQSFSNDLENTSHRGVIIFVQNDISAQSVDSSIVFNEHVFISTLLQDSKRLLIGNIYRSPNRA